MLEGRFWARLDLLDLKLTGFVEETGIVGQAAEFAINGVVYAASFVSDIGSKTVGQIPGANTVINAAASGFNAFKGAFGFGLFSSFKKAVSGAVKSLVNVGSSALKGVGQAVTAVTNNLPLSGVLNSSGGTLRLSFQVDLSDLRKIVPFNLDFEIPTFDTGAVVSFIPASDLTIDSAIVDSTGPGGSIRFTGSSPFREFTTIDLYVDSDGTGYDGQLIAGGILLEAGQQSYQWRDLAAFSSLGYDPEKKIYVYGLINTGPNTFASDYSAAITPPNFTPAISVPDKQSFGTNQSLVFSSREQNAITVTDPLAAQDPKAELVVTLDVRGGTLTLDPEQATP